MAMTAAQKLDAYRFFAIAFDAVPGVTYMNQLDTAYAGGMTTQQIVNVYTTKAEFLAVYPTFFDNTQFATKLVETIVGTAATDANKAAAVADIVGAINAGSSRGDVIFTIFSNLAAKPADDAAWGATSKLLANQVKVAEYYTETLLGTATDLTTLRSVIGSVTPTTDVSTTAALAAVVTASGTGGAVAGSTFTLTTGVDTIIANDGNNTIDGSRSVLSGQIVDVLGSADSIDGGAGTDTLFVQNVTANSSIAPASIKNVEVLQIENMAAGTYTLNLASADASVKTVKIGNTTGGSVTVSNNSAALTNLDVSNVSQAVTVSSIAAAVAGTSDSLAVSLSSATGAAGVSVAGYETVGITSSGSVANSIGILTDSALTTLNIAGTQNVTLTTGATSLAMATINAATATGKVSVTLNGAQTQAVTITGGTVNDTINMGGTYTSADTINGGTGTDTLTLTSAEVAAATTAQTNVTSIETIAVSAAVGANVVYSLTNFGATTLALDGTAMAAGTLGITYSAGTNGLSLDVSASGGAVTATTSGVATTDVLNVTMGSATNSTGNTFGANAFVSIGAETVNVSSVGAANSFGAAVTLTNTAATETLNITGSQNLTIAGAVTADVINAAGMTGTAALIMTVGQTTVSAGATITGTANADTLIGSANADIINGGAGNDNIVGMAGADIITGGAGTDTFRYTVAGQGSNASTITANSALTAGDLITDFVSGTGGDLINVNALATTHAAASGAAAAWNLGTAGVYIITGASLDFVATTTTVSAIATAVGAVTGTATNVGYVAILDTQSTTATTDDQYNIFEVTLAANRAGAAIQAGDTISLIGTISGTALVAADFTA